MKNIIPQALLTMPILSTGLQAQEKQPTPNLVFIMADQYRGDAIGCIGKEPVKTPHLDKLASEGINFTNAISSYPVSSPARGMLMTGKMCIRDRTYTPINYSLCHIPCSRGILELYGS